MAAPLAAWLLIGFMLDGGQASPIVRREKRRQDVFRANVMSDGSATFMDPMARTGKKRQDELGADIMSEGNAIATKSMARGGKKLSGVVQRNIMSDGTIAADIIPEGHATSMMSLARGVEKRSGVVQTNVMLDGTAAASGKAVWDGGTHLVAMTKSGRTELARPLGAKDAGVDNVRDGQDVRVATIDLIAKLGARELWAAGGNSSRQGATRLNTTPQRDILPHSSFAAVQALQVLGSTLFLTISGRWLPKNASYGNFSGGVVSYLAGSTAATRDTVKLLSPTNPAIVIAAVIGVFCIGVFVGRMSCGERICRRASGPRPARESLRSDDGRASQVNQCVEVDQNDDDRYALVRGDSGEYEF